MDNWFLEIPVKIARMSEIPFGPYVNVFTESAVTTLIKKEVTG